MGAFVSDVTPESTAEQLRAASATGVEPRSPTPFGAGRRSGGLARAGPGQPHRRAHRLQRRLRAALRVAARASPRRSPRATTGGPAGDARTRTSRSRSPSPTLRPGQPSTAGRPTWPAWSGRCGEHGHAVGGADVVVDADVPVGAGLSSLGRARVRRRRRPATTCRRSGSTGADWSRSASAGGERLRRRARRASWTSPRRCCARRATRCSSTPAAGDAEQVPFDLDAAGLALLVIDTWAPHRHVDGDYARAAGTASRRAPALGVAALRDVTVDDLPARWRGSTTSACAAGAARGHRERARARRRVAGARERRRPRARSGRC